MRSHRLPRPVRPRTRHSARRSATHPRPLRSPCPRPWYLACGPAPPTPFHRDHSSGRLCTTCAVALHQGRTRRSCHARCGTHSPRRRGLLACVGRDCGLPPRRRRRCRGWRGCKGLCNNTEPGRQAINTSEQPEKDACMHFRVAGRATHRCEIRNCSIEASSFPLPAAPSGVSVASSRIAALEPVRCGASCSGGKEARLERQCGRQQTT